MSTEPELPVPARRRSITWWGVLLVISLALNLLVGGAVAARFFIRPPIERMAGASYLQLVPRHFFMDMDRQRRDELLKLLRSYRDQFRAGQQRTRDTANKLADALDANPYDEAQVRAVVETFASNGNELLDLSTKAAMDFISHLTPEERVRLAQRIRERTEPHR
jgi:uncharacterized membrane protein